VYRPRQLKSPPTALRGESRANQPRAKIPRMKTAARSQDDPYLTLQSINHHTSIVHHGREVDLPSVVSSAVEGESVITYRTQVFSLVMEVWMICYTEKKIDQD
jgi:hypothetical protein